MKYGILAFCLSGILALGAGGCKSQAEALEDNYAKTVDAHGTNRNRCAAAREIADAFAREGNDEKYSEWHGDATMTCLRAELGQ